MRIKAQFRSTAGKNHATVKPRFGGGGIMRRYCKIQALGYSLVLLVMAVPAAHSSISFSNPITYSAGPNPSQVITADFNGDRKVDMAVLNPAISPKNTGS